MKNLLTLLLAAMVSVSFAADNVKTQGTAKTTAGKKTTKKKYVVRHGNYGLKTATTPAPRSQKWKQRLADKAEQAKQSGKDVQIVLVGDSITFRWENKRVQKTVYKDVFGKYNVLNLGFNGDRTQHTLWVIEKSGVFEHISPKMIVLLIGTNNTGGGVSGEVATAAAIKRCVESLRKAAPEAKIVLFAIFPRGDKKGNILYKKNEMVNDIIKDLGDNKNVFFVNINRDFLDENGVASKKLLYDYLHPNAAGYKVWGKAITPFIQRFVDGK